MANTQIGKFWLLMPWLIIALGIPTLLWWTFEPVPIEITYVAPHFVSQPVTNRFDASKYPVTAAKGGTTLWRYVEYCVRRPYEGVSHRAWVGEALVWHAPDLATQFSRVPGCSSISVATPLPTNSPTRTFNYMQRMEIVMNPIRTEEIVYPPIPLTILDGKE